MMEQPHANYAIQFAKLAHLHLNAPLALLKITELYQMDNASVQMDFIKEFLQITQLFVVNAAVNANNVPDPTLALIVQLQAIEFWDMTQQDIRHVLVLPVTQQLLMEVVFKTDALEALFAQTATKLMEHQYALNVLLQPTGFWPFLNTHACVTLDFSN